MLRKLWLGLLALRELGIRRVFLFGIYRIGLFTGYFRWRTPARKQRQTSQQPTFQPVFTLPEKAELMGLLGGQLAELIQEAEEILDGKVRLFGGDPVSLLLNPNGAEKHWTKFRVNAGEDIKFIWEPGRFGWAFTLGRAYLATGDERYAAAFWSYWEVFTASNPVNCGPNWQSGQEVALRLIALLYALQVFSKSSHSTQERTDHLLQAIVDHSNRIPPTLIYARAQDNNHLISEACGLLLAGTALPDNPRAVSWRQTGIRWLEYAFRKQFEADGSYIQHSMNYHRMVLQLALLALTGASKTGKHFSSEVMANLAAGTRWLIAQMDAQSGDTPNLGNNDGALVLPLAASSFRDHRPTAQAAAAAFLGAAVLPAGSWDELAAWLGIDVGSHPDAAQEITSLGVKRLGSSTEWGTLRAVHYRSRPAHADQLHVELWFHGGNVLCDAGTYAYSLLPPWDNSLVHSRSHNTVTIDGKDPMLRAGRFLWLRWDQARWVEEDCRLPKILTAEHYGYQRKGLSHKRSLEWIKPGQWEVTDWVDPLRKSGEHRLTLRWLVMDGKWVIDADQLTVMGKHEKVILTVSIQGGRDIKDLEQRLVRGGSTLYGKENGLENEGWYSPTYARLEPALSYQVTIPFSGPMVIQTRIELERLAYAGYSPLITRSRLANMH